MSEFTTAGLKLCFPHKSDGLAVLLESIEYEAGYKGSGVWITIEAGFPTDGASVPRPLWALLPPFGSIATKAAILHDYLLYRLHSDRPVPGFETRKAIDDEFHIALLALDVGKSEAWIVWAGARGFSMLRETILPKDGFSVQTR